MEYNVGGKHPLGNRSTYDVTPVLMGAEVNIDGTIISPILQLDIHQRHGCHNSMTLLFYHDSVQQGDGFMLEDAAALYGKVVEIIIKDRNDPDGGELLEKFVITQVELGQQYLAEGILTIKALSPTHLLDGSPHYESFTNKTLAQIVAQVCRPMERMKGWQKIVPHFNDTLPYVCRFNETGWNFLKRLASSMGEWLFFDGTQLVFGKPGKGQAAVLEYGRNTDTIQLGMATAPLQSSLFGYDEVAAAGMAKAANTDDGGTGSYAGQAAFKRNQFLFAAAATATMPQSLKGRFPLDAMATASSTGAAAGMYGVTGTSTNFMLRVGGLADLSFHRFGQHATHGQLRITAVHHSLGKGGRYSNSFEAIPAEAMPPPLKFVQPATHPLLARVTENADPHPMGRVKVQFLGWQQEHNQETDWVRVCMPDAGSGLAGGNRGHGFFPEIGDEVVVGFMGNNPDDPIVTGAVFHGGNGRGGGPKNHLKTITTRSGTKLQWDDTDGKGSFTATDPSGNRVYLDGQGNVTITAPGNIILNAGENVLINAGLNIIANAGMNITESAGMSIGHNAAEMISQVAGKDYSLMAANIIKMAKENITTSAKKGTKQAEENITTNSQKGSVNKHAQKGIQNNSNDKSKLH